MKGDDRMTPNTAVADPELDEERDGEGEEENLDSNQEDEVRADYRKLLERRDSLQTKAEFFKAREGEEVVSELAAFLDERIEYWTDENITLGTDNKTREHNAARKEFADEVRLVIGGLAWDDDIAQIEREIEGMEMKYPIILQ